MGVGIGGTIGGGRKVDEERGRCKQAISRTREARLPSERSSGNVCKTCSLLSS
jgi:hypothetical protein